MTTPEIAPQKDRWLRAIGYGLLAEIATIFTIVAVVLLYRSVFKRDVSDAEYVAFGQQAGAILGIVGGTVYVYVFAHRLMRLLASRFVAHGIIVAIAAVALSIGGSLAGHQGVPPLYALASALKLLAGGFAGYLASRRAHGTS
jgi:hypothetical protein